MTYIANGMDPDQTAYERHSVLHDKICFGEN